MAKKKKTVYDAYKEGVKARSKTKSHYGQVSKKTETAGKQGKENREEARNAAVKKKTTEAKPKTAGQGGGRRNGATPTSQTATQRRAGAVKASNTVQKTVNPRVIRGEANEKKKTYLQNGTATNYSAAGKAYNQMKRDKEDLYNGTKKTVTTKSEASIAYNAAMKSIKDVGKYYATQSAEASKYYDKQAKKAKKEGMYLTINKEDFVKQYMQDPSHKKNIRDIAQYNKKAERDAHTYEYSTAREDSDSFFKQMVASQPALAYQHVKTETNIPEYKLDKDGNIKYDKNGDPIVKKDKNGNTVYQKIDSTLGKNIINQQAGGFNEKGQLTSQAGTEAIGANLAGWMREGKFGAGLLQGNAWSDIRKGLGD